MEQKIDMIVNRLPAKTWNRLSVNQAEIKDLICSTNYPNLHIIFGERE